MPVVYFTVTNDLSYDQRMIRICNSLAGAGYCVVLVGRRRKHSIPLEQKAFGQKRLFCFFESGKLFYLEFNLRLLLYLITKKMHAICAIDLDTIIPCLLTSRLKGVQRIYDAHELFCEMEEIVRRPLIYRIWKWVERNTVPHFTYGYTVNNPIADNFKKMYGVTYEVIRSIALYAPVPSADRENFIIYQGAVNEGRSFETLIPAMEHVHTPLLICGEGNFLAQAKEMVKTMRLEDKVYFKGMVPPKDLAALTRTAKIGFTLFSNKGLSNYFSLANRFFDYIHAGTPQICVDYPAYRALNEMYNVAVLTRDLSPEALSRSINSLLNDKNSWAALHTNCMEAATVLNWQMEEKKLIQFYKHILG